MPVGDAGCRGGHVDRPASTAVGATACVPRTVGWDTGWWPGLGLTVSVPATDGELDTGGEGLTDSDGLTDGEVDGDSDSDGLTDGEEEGDTDSEGLTDGDIDSDGLTDGEDDGVTTGQSATEGSGSSFGVFATMTTDRPWASLNSSPT